ncbi:ferrous iron transport protein B [Candidatus Igneacidithiobacillus taiwanensis]|uniref:ferrous iron transport protein B n=1 Tax=Candidatus Igneacidithiobacillus taiwanensis TaxID=1945924 RepID=UPI0028986505|nr:ferrous iron transport protein B [Candidatus Igneacidithiobacillus taiwanensis]MCE5359535.1 ferrous iron transport protein B [Acidithiobacillus sp.]
MSGHCAANTQPIGKLAADGLPLVALVGNPNCGKTTVYNLLTGTQQSVGNWPGVTVEKREGLARIGNGNRTRIVDLPGLYSILGGGGEDQSVARRFLQEGDADLIVQVLDASNLERHLLLTAELLDLGRPLLVVLNMMDEAANAGWNLDPEALEKLLQLPVVTMVARKGRGLAELRQAIAAALSEKRAAQSIRWEEPIEGILAALAEQFDGPACRSQAWQALADRRKTPDALVAARDLAAAQLQASSGEEPADFLASLHFDWAARIAGSVAQRAGAAGWRSRLTQALDHWVLHEIWGVPIFLLVLYLVFVVSFSGGNVFLDFFDQASAALLINGFGHLLLQAGAPGWLVTALAGGLGGGLNLVISFIPPIGLTFLFLAFLEDSGYMARAAYVMDRLMRRFGLPGNALVPMVIGFGCNVPAIMGSRIIEDPRGRVLTVLMQPFMSCSARLTIYMAFAVVFFRSNGGQVVFLLYLTGILMSLFTAWLLGNTALRGSARAFVLELPPYRLPNWRSVGLQAWQRLKVFVLRVGKVIAAIGFVLFILPGIGWTQGGLRATDIDHSLLAQGSRALTPLFAPMGIHPDNWPAVAGLVAGAAAKEVVIGTLNGIYQRQAGADALASYRHPDIGAQLLAAVETIPENAKKLVTSLQDPLGFSDLGNKEAAINDSGASNDTLTGIARDFTPLSALAYLLFVLLYIPCASTMGALRREIGMGWMLFSIAYGVGMAWAIATLVYQLGTASEHPETTALWTGLIVMAFAALYLGLHRHGRRTGPQSLGAKKA